MSDASAYISLPQRWRLEYQAKVMVVQSKARQGPIYNGVVVRRGLCLVLPFATHALPQRSPKGEIRNTKCSLTSPSLV